jgi:hypothetical protein
MELGMLKLVGTETVPLGEELGLGVGPSGDEVGLEADGLACGESGISTLSFEKGDA